ncbi:MAG: TIGR04013 family B12-binding domain/radical SAM domain-containing protein [Candidatus Heimdallarchaeota archaeon]|nr:MAG: TIGR04013 family B12-binding domain/radical SAM domain-containing protein [Candidatus Heimdallarchaeota archaeon]
MQESPSKCIVLLYWDKTTWYALGALTSSLQKHSLPYEIIRGDPLPQIRTKLDQGLHVIYGESSRITTIDSLKGRLQLINNQISSPNLLLVIGGPHASGAPEKILKMGADYVVIGEGEATFPELIQTWINNKFRYERLHSLPGIAFRDISGKFIQSPPRPRIILDEYCPYSDNKDFALHPPIELMRGCSFRCRFCQVPYIYGNPRFRSIETITKIVEHYVQYFKPLKTSVDIRFIAPNSLGYMEKKRGQPNYEALTKLLRRLTQYEIRLFFGTFPSEIRPEYITDKILSLFDMIANQQFSVGFQSGSDRVLKEMRRGHSVADGLQAYDLMVSQGFTPVFDFLLGVPSETKAEQWQTLSLIRELGKKAQTRLHYFMPLPGTPWKNSSPALLSPEIQSEIGRLAKSKIIMGAFAKQFQIAFKDK